MIHFNILIPSLNWRGYTKRLQSTRENRVTNHKVLGGCRGCWVGHGEGTAYLCIWTTEPESSNTRIIARCDREWERYFAYAIALRTASGPAYQIGPYRNSSLIRSKPSLSLRGRTSYRSWLAVNPRLLCSVPFASIAFIFRRFCSDKSDIFVTFSRRPRGRSENRRCITHAEALSNGRATGPHTGRIRSAANPWLQNL